MLGLLCSSGTIDIHLCCLPRRLMGVQLIATYLLIALLYLFVPNFAPNTNT